MKQVLKDKWVAALRSDQYQQGRGLLRTNHEEYCCLGVLCDLMVASGEGEWEQDGSRYRFTLITPMPGPSYEKHSTTSVPTALKNLLGVSVEVVEDLIHRNDSLHASFASIADYINQYVEGT